MTTGQQTKLEAAAVIFGPGIVLQAAREACQNDALPAVDPRLVTMYEAAEVLRIIETAQSSTIV